MQVLAAGHRRILLAWGAVMGVLVAIAVPFWPEPRPGNLTAVAWGWWLAAFAAFFLLFWVSLARSPRPRAWRLALLAGESISVLTLVSLHPALGIEGALFVPIAFQLGRERPVGSVGALRRYIRSADLRGADRGADRSSPMSILWITLQTVAMFAIMKERFGFEHAFSLFAAYFPFQLLAFYTSSLLSAEEQGRNEVARVNAELMATREILADNSRAAERLRIARELHDVFGHRLAALSLNLEIAARVGGEERPQYLGKAREITKSLLGEVREVAANLRADSSLDLGRAVRRLVQDVPSPRVHLDCPQQLRTRDGALAQVLLRCTQEAVTNAMKYANAANLWISVREDDAGIELQVADDGEGASDLHVGNGLRGMRERVAELGGSVDVSSARQAGFRVRVFVPAVGAPVAAPVAAPQICPPDVPSQGADTSCGSQTSADDSCGSRS